ncbi:hypothetical protein C8R44DRAFT_739605 [Mycena epipterygia]|nr:hypothetical protein C8R44DRAFT_739605 [Mycena epipterygia]
MSYASGYGQYPDTAHTYGYLGTPTEQDSLKAASESTGHLTPRRAAKATQHVPPSPKKLWVPALTIIGSLIVGCLFAIGHHVYYNSLSGHAVESTSVFSGLKVYDQKWANHVGTGLAFLTKFFFSLCIGAAYVETLWKIARRPLGLSVAGLNASFGLLSNPMNFMSTDLLFSAQFLLLLAAISWLVPVVTVFTPGALTVDSQFVNGTIACSVPALNLASTNAANNLGTYSVVDHTQQGTFNGASQTMKRLATTTLLGGYITPASPCVASASVCTYSTSYVAPYFECGDVILGNYTGDPNFKQSGGTTLFNATYLPSTSAGDTMILAWDGISATGYEGYVLTCSAMNATYNVDVQHQSGTHTVEASSIVVNGVLTTDASLLGFQDAPLSNPLNPDYTRALILSATVMAALQDMLVGTIEASDSSSPSLTLTVNQTMIAMSNLGQINEQARNFTPGDNMPALVTSLLQNITIGLMASNISDVAATTTCVQSGTQNIYVYHPTTLWPPYAAAAACALFATIIGMSALLSNRSPADTNFTKMIECTRNTALDSVPGEDPGRIRLRYGLINDSGNERMAFGQLWNFGEHPLARKEGAA